MMRNIFGRIVCVLGVLGSSVCVAQDWSVKVGVNTITPHVQSGDMTAPTLPGTKADVGSDTQPTVSLTYRFNGNLSAELVLGTPYQHKLYGAGSIAGVGKVGTVDVLPPTVYGQYRFLEEESKFRPYIGLGVTYASFQNETGSGALTALTNPGSPTPTTFSVDAAWGLSPQIGILYRFGEQWFADISVTQSLLKTTTRFSTGQTLDMKLDPTATNVAIGWMF